MSIKGKVLYAILRKKIKVHFKGKINYQALRKGTKNLSKFCSKHCQIINLTHSQALKVFDGENNDGVMIYLHGGSYVQGVSGMHVNVCEKLVKSTGYISYILDYRLAPEYSYKEAHEDVFALYQYIKQTHPKKNLMIIGDSAGGGLALAFVMSLSKQGLELPRKLALISPWLDVSMANKNLTDDIDKLDPILSKEGLQSAGQYYRRNLDDKHYLVSPLYGSIDNLPPILMISSRDDLLQCDADDFYEILKGSNIEYIKYGHLPHDFVIIPYVFKESKMVIDKIAKFMID